VQALDLFLHLFDVQIQAVHVLEAVEVELLDLYEMRDKFLDFGEACCNLSPKSACRVNDWFE
jgi:hypothetical protein